AACKEPIWWRQRQHSSSTLRPPLSCSRQQAIASACVGHWSPSFGASHPRVDLRWGSFHLILTRSVLTGSTLRLSCYATQHIGATRLRLQVRNASPASSHHAKLSV